MRPNRLLCRHRLLALLKLHERVKLLRPRVALDNLPKLRKVRRDLHNVIQLRRDAAHKNSGAASVVRRRGPLPTPAAHRGQSSLAHRIVVHGYLAASSSASLLHHWHTTARPSRPTPHRPSTTTHHSLHLLLRAHHTTSLHTSRHSALRTHRTSSSAMSTHHLLGVTSSHAAGRAAARSARTHLHCSHASRPLRLLSLLLRLHLVG